HADIVVVGEAEPLWSRVLRDIEYEVRYPVGQHLLDEHTRANVEVLPTRGKIYRCPTAASLAKLPVARRDLIQHGALNKWWTTNPTTPLSLALCLSALTMREIRLVIASLNPGHEGKALLNRIRMQGVTRLRIIGGAATPSALALFSPKRPFKCHRKKCANIVSTIWCCQPAYFRTA